MPLRIRLAYLPATALFFDIVVVDANPNIASFSANAESGEYSMMSDDTPAPKLSVAGPAITLGLDKESYRFGEIIRITGNVSGLISSERFAVIEILYPGGVLYDRKIALVGMWETRTKKATSILTSSFPPLTWKTKRSR